MEAIRVLEHETFWQIQCPVTGYTTIPRDGRWTFNGDFERPTFSSSVNIGIGAPGQNHEEMQRTGPADRNHFFVRNGCIEYCSDCTHALVGQVVDLPAFSEAEIRLHSTQ